MTAPFSQPTPGPAETAPGHTTEGAAEASAPPDLPEPIDLSIVAAVAKGKAPASALGIDPSRIARGAARLDDAIRAEVPIYGVTTGFGPLADRPIPAERRPALQEKLIAHLASGTGRPYPWRIARTIAAVRLRTIVAGYSGARAATTSTLARLLDSQLAPWIPQQGTVGASGDLTPLAHLALALMGRGAFLLPPRPLGTVDGALAGADLDTFSAPGPAHWPGSRHDAPLADAATVAACLGGTALHLHARDGLALVNGTAAMTGVAVDSQGRVERLLRWATLLSVGLAEVLRGRAEAWHQTLAAIRPHPGQRTITAALAALTAGSARLDHGFLARRAASGPDRAATPSAQESESPRTCPQDAYTIRCVPQVLGAVADTVSFHREVVGREVNAVTDNPIFPPPDSADGALALHGGNFMGLHVALASDALSAAVLSLAGLAERQIARLTDERLNNGLPPFLTRGHVGLDSGLMGAQVSATALLAEMRTRAVPASAMSISTNGANQDVVSMGTIAARRASQHLDDAARILAILAIAVTEAVAIRSAENATRPFARATDALCRAVRRTVPPILADRPLGAEIEMLAMRLAEEEAPA
ncbi:MAG: aromatic amino acid ammonia-lyase [Pseudomonadota bacterium]